MKEYIPCIWYRQFLGLKISASIKLLSMVTLKLHIQYLSISGALIPVRSEGLRTTSLV